MSGWRRARSTATGSRAAGRCITCSERRCATWPRTWITGRRPGAGARPRTTVRARGPGLRLPRPPDPRSLFRPPSRERQAAEPAGADRRGRNGPQPRRGGSRGGGGARGAGELALATTDTTFGTPLDTVEDIVGGTGGQLAAALAVGAALVGSVLRFNAMQLMGAVGVGIAAGAGTGIVTGLVGTAIV